MNIILVGFLGFLLGVLALNGMSGAYQSLTGNYYTPSNKAERWCDRHRILWFVTSVIECAFCIWGIVEIV